MDAHGRMLSLIRHVYRAAPDATQWPAVLEHLSDQYHGGVAGLQYRTGIDGQIHSSTFVRFDPALQRTYGSYFATRNPWTRLSQPLFQPGLVYTPESVLPLPQLERTEFYDGILQPAGVVHCFGACVLRRGDDVLSFTVVRSRRRGPYTVGELNGVRHILPHLRRAVQVNERLSSLAGTRARLADGLDSLQHGVVVVNRHGRVVFANQAARTIVALRDGLTITADGLQPTSRDERRRLRALLDDSVRTRAGEGFSAGGAMTVARPSMKRPFLLLVAPLTLPLESEGGSGMSTVFISDPEAQIESIDALVRRLYGLTATEAKVANAFLTSGNLDQAAEQLHLSRETVRWHLRHIYRKTGTNRQTALLKLLIQGASRLKLAACQIASLASHPHT
jgi:DNA-binding CsgD family transcriptional regulator